LTKVIVVGPPGVGKTTFWASFAVSKPKHPFIYDPHTHLMQNNGYSAEIYPSNIGVDFVR